MSVDIHGEAPTPPSETDLNKALQEFEESCRELLRACRMYMNLPIATNLKAITKTAEGTIGPWEASMKSIFNDDTIDMATRAQIVTTLLEDNDARRTAYLGRILEKTGVFNSIGDPNEMAASLETQFTAEGVSVETAIASLKQMYINGLNADLALFLGEVNKQPRAKIIAQGRTIGNHLFDVAKVGAGAWLGIELSRHASRRISRD